MRTTAILAAAALISVTTAWAADTPAERPKTRVLKSAQPPARQVSAPQNESPLVKAARSAKDRPKAKVSINKDNLKTTGGNITTTNSTYEPPPIVTSVIDTSAMNATPAPKIDRASTEEKIRDLQNELASLHDQFVDESEDPASTVGDYEGIEGRMTEIPKEVERLRRLLKDLETSQGVPAPVESPQPAQVTQPQ